MEAEEWSAHRVQTLISVNFNFIKKFPKTELNIDSMFAAKN